MESMSHGGEIFGLGGDAASEPSFETALRGYEKKQVERYVSRAENEIAALANERDQAYQQMQAMQAQIERLQQEAAQARRQPGVGAEVSYRHLGPRVEQILALAEEQAEAIKASATDDTGRADKAAATHRHPAPPRRGGTDPGRIRGARA